MLVVWDIETIPNADVIGIVKHDDPEYQNLGRYEKIVKLKEELGTGFLPIVYHRVIAISLVIVNDTFDQFQFVQVPGNTEYELLTWFANLINVHGDNIKLLGWNSKGFDAQVINYRMSAFRIPCPLLQKNDGNYKWDSFSSRFHSRHTDLMDVMSNYNSRAIAALDPLCHAFGLPGKYTLDKNLILEIYMEGKLQTIRNYCDTDVINLLIIYIRWLEFTGVLSLEYDATKKLLSALDRSNMDHLKEFATLARNSSLVGLDYSLDGRV